MPSSREMDLTDTTANPLRRRVREHDQGRPWNNCESPLDFPPFRNDSYDASVGFLSCESQCWFADLIAIEEPTDVPVQMLDQSVRYFRGRSDISDRDMKSNECLSDQRRRSRHRDHSP